MEAYSPTSKYCIPGDYSRPPRKCLHTSADYQETFCDKQREKADLAQDHFNQTLHEQSNGTQRANTLPLNVVLSTRPLEHR